jgi:hypothetical protein
LEDAPELKADMDGKAILTLLIARTYFGQSADTFPDKAFSEVLLMEVVGLRAPIDLTKYCYISSC